MKYTIYTLGLLCAVLATSLYAMPSQVIIIPNAEVDISGNLTQVGAERAGALPPYIIYTPDFTAFGIPIAIFAARPDKLKPFQTCIQTIAPTARALKLPIHSGYSAAQLDQLAAFIIYQPLYNDKNVLICWPVESIAALAVALGVTAPPDSTDLNVAWVITFSPVSLTLYPQNLLWSDCADNEG